jgi:alkylation response protein AidB-like acyl-CoA dehydrogenase
MTDTKSAPDAERDLPDLGDYRAQVRDWLAANLAGRTDRSGLRNYHEYDAAWLPENRALQRKIYEAGYAGITWPVEFGGQGLPGIYESIFNEEAENFVLPDFGALVGTTFAINVPTIMAHAQPEFLRTFVPQVLAGEALVCQFFSEPSGGSDLAGARTHATKDGEQWVINGQKIWSTFAHFADWGLCLARTNWEVPKHRGLTWFAIPTHAPGVTIRPIRQLDGTASFCEDFFEDVIVPDAYRVGDVDEGWTVAQTMLVFERGAGRTSIAAEMAAPGEMAPDLVDVARRAGRLDDPTVRQRLARGHVIDYVGKALARRISLAGRAGGFNPGLAAYGKLFSGVYNPVRARLGVEIGGTGAMTWDEADPHGHDVSIAYLNGRMSSIAGGTNEMQRNGISERVLGMPRETSVDTQRPFNEVLRDARNWVPTRL